MARPSQVGQQRQRLLPIVATTFCELGFRRTTTAELARRCEVQENILYRLWPDKKSMYLAAIQLVFAEQSESWGKILSAGAPGKRVWEQLLRYEAAHQGERGMYRILFDAFGEADDTDVHETLLNVYRGFHKLVEKHLQKTHSLKSTSHNSDNLSADSTAWALIGLATVSNMIRELNLLKPRQREQMFMAVGKHLITK